MTAPRPTVARISPAPCTDDTPLLAVRDLTTQFPTRHGWLTAVNHISYELQAGRVLGVLGESGSGKSAMLRTILGLQPKSTRIAGEVLLDGRDLISMSAAEREDMRGASVSMVFQDPMTALDPVFTVEQQLVETIRRHSTLSRTEAAARALELLQTVQIPSPERRLKAYPFELSGGMRQRVVIAIALVSNPRLLLADEPTTALDVTVQARVLDLFRDLKHRMGMGIIFVTHDLAVAAEIADDIAVMYAGRIVEFGSLDDIVRSPQHPYTRGLLEANIRPGQHERPEAIPGSPPNLAKLPPGCSFAPRCHVAEAACWEAVPAATTVAPGHGVRCLKAAVSVETVVR
ncbi:MAG: ABC transporter ATP-binding protein [Dehalococcoidia bacterium]|nr:MAG: ABC transporter ATP-binding protein [Dehalococcoidia bacterium]